MPLQRFNARDLINWSLDKIKTLPLKHDLVFDDGETLEAWQNETIYSYLFWGLFKPYPSARLLKKHHVQVVLRGEALDTDTHNTLCTNILKTIVTECDLIRPEQKEPLLEAIYDTISAAMGILSILTVRDVVSIDILDFIQISKLPEIIALRESAKEDPRRIKFVSDEAVKIITTHPALINNGLAKAMKSKMVKANQVVQCVVFRGFSTEVDGTIFPEPVWSNYTSGNRSFYDFMADSRLAAKAHFYSDTSLKNSEYTARRFQLFAMVLERIVYKDCGSDRHVVWKVVGPTYDDSGAKTNPGHLPNLVGKYYLDEETNTYKMIEGNETHLIGKTIKFRSMLYCNTEDPHSVCHICAGGLSHNVSRFINLGFLGSVTITKEFTQNILSIKHVNTSSMVLKVLLGDHERNFLNTGVDGTSFFLNRTLSDLNPTITVNCDEAPGLVDLMKVDDIWQLNLPRVSSTTSLLITTSRAGKKGYSVQSENVVNVEQKLKSSMLSRELLQYVKTKGWTLNDQNNFVFGMSEWDYSLPILSMANKEESFVDLANESNHLVRSSVEKIKERQLPGAADQLLYALFELVTSKLRVNISAMEMVIYPLMVKSITSYELARGNHDGILGIAELLTKFRSLGPALAYEKQNEVITKPESFYQGRKPDSIMDVFLTPREYVDALHARQQETA